MTWPDVDRPLLASHPVDPYDGPILFKKSPCADECHAGIGAGSGSPSGASEHAHDDIHDGNDCTDHHPPTSCMEPSDDGQGEEDSLDEGLGLRWVVLALNCLLVGQCIHGPHAVAAANFIT